MELPRRVKSREEIVACFEKAREVTKKEHHLYVAFFDGNGIKLVNDTLGHHAGDAAINAIASALSDNLRLHDQIVRFGGDEFVVLLPNFDDGSVKIFVDRLQDAVKNHPHCKKLGNITTSVGVAKFDPLKHRTVQDILSEADALMYAAKKDQSGFAKFSTDKLLVDTRKHDKFDLRTRIIFDAVLKIVASETPGCNLGVLKTAARRVFAGQKHKIHSASTLNEIVAHVRWAYEADVQKAS